MCVVCIPLNPLTKSNGYDLLNIRLRNFYQQRDLEMSISESGPCSQVKHGLWEEKGGLWSLLTRGLYSEGKYRVIFLRGILSGLCREGVLVRGWSLGQV